MAFPALLLDQGAQLKRPAAWFYATALPASLLAAACLALYWRSLGNLPFFDDLFIFAGSTLRQHIVPARPWQLRWLPYATFSWTQAVLGDHLLWYHVGNLILHIANAIMLMTFVRRLYVAVQPPAAPPSGKVLPLDICAFLGALLFALHPAATYAAGYLNQRSTLMAMLFFLLMLHAFLSALLGGRSRDYFFAVLSYLLAAYCKEHIVMAPAVALALAVLVKKPGRGWVRQLWWPALLFALVGLSVIAQVRTEGIIGHAYQVHGKGLLARTLDPAHLAHPFLLSIMTQCLLFFKYWELWLVPNPAWMAVDMYVPFATHFLSWPQLVGVLAFLLYGTGAVVLLLLRGRLGLLGFVLLVPWLLFATELSTVRIQEPFVLYRSYLWMAIPVSCLPLLLRPLGPARLVVYLGAILLLFIPLSLNRLQTFSMPLLVWDDAVLLAETHPPLPGMERVYENRGNALLEMGIHRQAIQDYTRALHLNPGDSIVYANRGNAWLALKNYQQAVLDFDRAIKLQVHARALPDAALYSRRGIAYHEMKQDLQAVADFDRYLRSNPKDGRIWWYRGQALAALGLNDAAVSSLSMSCRTGFFQGCR